VDKPSVILSIGRATIVWRSPAYDGGRTVIGYTVEARHANEGTWMVITERCHSLSHTVPTTERSSVVPGESYCFRVRSENIHGLSDPGMESDPVRIPREGETMFHDEEKGDDLILNLLVSFYEILKQRKIRREDIFGN